MAFVGIRSPHEIARLLSQIEVPGKREPVEEMHVTLMCFDKDLPIEIVGQAIVAIYGVTAKTKPFTVRTNRVTTFPAGDDGVPVICPIESPPLHALRDKLAKALDDAGVSYSKKFPVYKPHLTLAYADRKVDRGFPEVEWGVGEVVLWAGDRGDNRLVTTFPFWLAPSKTAMHRGFVRASLHAVRLGTYSYLR